MLDNLSIKGFKCFDNIKIDLKPITLLVGKNSSGKSSIIQTIIALKQSGGNPFRGDYINIGEISELMNANIGAEEITISAEYDNGKKDASIRIRGLNATNVEKKKLDSEIVYCSAERIGVRDTYEKSKEDSFGVGIDCRYAFSYYCKRADERIDDIFVYDPDTLLTFRGQVDYWLSEIVGCKVDASYIESTDLVKVRYSDCKDGKTNNWVRPQNIGTGVSYIASTIIAAFSCNRGGILIIENPEIHLHPAAQSKFLEFLAFISLCGVQVIIETHSDHIFNGVRTCVHNNFINKDDQCIYFFKEKENGCSEPVKVDLYEDGRLMVSEDGLFDQIQKDLDIILDW